MNTENSHSTYNAAVQLDAECNAANAACLRAHQRLMDAAGWERRYQQLQADYDKAKAARDSLRAKRDEAWKAAKAART